MSNPSLSLPRPSFAATCLAGLIALAIAMGIGRFAFTPMLPLMIRAGSADVAAGGWLAAANYAGYLLGALTTARLPLTPQRVGLLALTLIVASTAAMGWTASLPAWLLLRFVAGVASAWALVSTSVWCLAWLSRFERPAGPGLLYAGVGAGIALAGLYCWRAGAADVAPDALWLQLGALALVGLAAVALLMPRGASGAAAPAPTAAAPAAAGGVSWGLVICYGLLGFGYILPATFLPVLARAVVDDPAVFGAAWPVFGAAAAVSTLFASLALSKMARRHVLAGSHALMALGCLLPVLHLSALTVLLAALLVGGTFMVATMAGMQEARARSLGDPTRALGRMTAAFAIGQMAGPMLSSLLSGSAQGFGGLFVALAIGALALAGSAWWLARAA
ncbi:MFS transporter [Variovorax sp. WS11]|uniref:YbfB/YjiJ family MFS transporter n=1 Tax=Variovorax sp. WS11 TaxID=1105204 RepID=UPI000D0D08F5|nr:YbfB/YjiJ family MFS transporter [Variovorax sp. WS11]NDZ16742.1 YbfB/YjiJ family MFS transporter [Variovorax sp. WS11]PSL80221.1 MFS transporter [Variovorax sp. WS11]